MAWKIGLLWVDSTKSELIMVSVRTEPIFIRVSRPREFYVKCYLNRVESAELIDFWFKPILQFWDNFLVFQACVV